MLKLSFLKITCSLPSGLKAIWKRLHSYSLPILVFQNFPMRISLEHGNIPHGNRIEKVNHKKFRKNITKKELAKFRLISANLWEQKIEDNIEQNIK